jgi:hypothetical protein
MLWEIDPEERARVRRFLTGDPVARKLMGLARTAHIPFSEAAARWLGDPEALTVFAGGDLLKEMVWDELLIEDQELRCPGCGIRDDEMYGPGGERGGIAKHTIWKAQVMDCEWCDALAELNARARGDQTERRKPWVRWALRRVGDALFPSGLGFRGGAGGGGRQSASPTSGDLD